MFSNLKHYKASCLFSVLSLILVIGNSTNANQNTIEKYGQSNGEPIDGGFFFYDNEYIEAPYVVERIGLEVFINGHKVDFVPEPYDWRIFDDPGEPPSDIQLPTCIPHKNTEYYNQYWGLKYRYLRANKTEEQANKDFTELMKNMPGVSKIETDPSNSKRLIITYNTSRTQTFDWVPEQVTGHEFAPIPKKEELIERAETSRQFHEQRLRNNNGFFDRSKGGRMIMGASAALRIIDILISEKNPEERIQALATPGSSRLGTDPWKSQLESIQTTPQLAQRAERIRKEIEDEGNAKNAVSIARGTEDWISNPVNVLGDPDLNLNIQGSSGNSTSDSNDKANIAKTIINDTTNENKPLVNTNNNDSQFKIILFTILLPITMLGITITIGLIAFISIRKKSIMKKTISRKYTIAIIPFIFLLFVCCVYMIRAYDTESRRKEGEKIIRDAASYNNGKVTPPDTQTDEYFLTIESLMIVYEKPFDLSLIAKFSNLQRLSLQDRAMHFGPASKPVIPKWKLICAKLGIIDLENTDSFDLRPIGKLSNLQELFLEGPMTSDIKPLSNLKNLKKLSLSGTRVNNLKPIKNLINLQELSVSKAMVSSLEPLKDMKNLKSLHIYDCPISDIESLKDLIGLQELRLDSTSVSDLEPIKGLTNLQRLDIIKTMITDLKPIKNLTNLKTLYLPILSDQYKDEQIEELKKALPNTKFVNVNSQ